MLVSRCLADSTLKCHILLENVREHFISVLFCVTEEIEILPLANTPEVFGLHPNAEIGYYSQAARDMWTHLIELQPQTGNI